MNWNYRVIVVKENDGHIFRIHEVFYDEQGRIASWTIHPIWVQSIKSIDDLRLDMGKYVAALDKPVLCVDPARDTLEEWKGAE